MSEVKFIDGIGVYKPHEKAPEFVKANVQIRKAELIEYLKDMPDKFNGQILESKNGNYYLKLDDYKKETEAQKNSKTKEDDLPF